MAGRLLRWLEHGGEVPAPAVMIVAAHPDDEVIGVGAQLPLLPGVMLVHVTDGAPRDLRDATAAGCAGWEDYARARRAELEAALELAGIGPDQAHDLGIADQAASFQMAALAEALAARFAGLGPELVITHPYEGGHPDHDACALAAHAACALLSRRGLSPPALVEMTSYHAANGDLVTSAFLPRPGVGITTLVLDPAAQALKRCLFECFATQRKILARFPIEVERFRPAPPYDFTRPPHHGPLYYEAFDWGVDGARWRALAGAALATLGLTGAL